MLLLGLISFSFVQLGYELRLGRNSPPLYKGYREKKGVVNGVVNDMVNG